MTRALAFDHLHVKRAIMVGPTCRVHRPLTGAVAVAIALAKESQHPQ
ncbi:MAG TPA: hypothetical protein VGQ13_04855 [Nitrososphaera sp.]|nr:hypothetical protein [Nitrososphaera sp.]